jgi:hypothetical protein
MVICDMPEQMDKERAARLLEQWISFYGMDNKEDWPREDYPFVKQSCEAMRLAIELLRGNKAENGADVKKAATQLEKWPQVHSMDDPAGWESEDFPFVKNALEAVRFAAAFLRQL